MNHKEFDVIIVGGSYSGLAAGMALGRALKDVLIIDSARPCNRQTPHSHNFLTRDGEEPAVIAALARQQLTGYSTVAFFNGLASIGRKVESGFSIQVESGETFTSKKLIFATGIKDSIPGIPGFKESWGISVLHCPYCHGYEARNTETGILGNGEAAFDFARLISNWTSDLRLFTNGASTLSADQTEQLKKRNIEIHEKEVEKLVHTTGHVKNILFKDGTTSGINTIYAPVRFEQHCRIPESLGCELTEDGYIKTDPFQETTVPGVFACGDNASRMRTIANAVAMGTTAGMTLSKKMIFEEF